MEKIFTEFVESMHRLYKNGMVQDKFVESLLEGKKISLDERKGGVICIPF